MSVQESNASNRLVEEKAQYLKEKLKTSLDRMRRNRNQNRRKATYVKLGIIGLTGTATLLLGLQLIGFEEYFKQAAFAFGSIATLLSALEPFFNFRALWIEHEEAEGMLYRLRDEFEYHLAGTTPENLSPEVLDSFLKRYLDIWDNLSKSWIEHRRREM